MIKGNLTPVLEKAYDDVVHPVASTTGKIFGLIPQAIYTALLPVRKWINDREEYFEEMGKLLAKKLKNVKEENIITPELYVAVPTIQALSYSLDNNELKNLYANLLARAMNIDTKEYVHPAFVEIIKQLSPIDALVFKEIAKRGSLPVIDLFYANEQYQGTIIAKNFTDVTVSTYEIESVSIDNLARLGLIEISNDTINDEELYTNIINSIAYEQIKSEFKDVEVGFKFYNYKKTIYITDLGKNFHKICVED